VCAVVESIDACHAHADRLQRVSDTTAQPVMEADRLFEAADTFVDMRGDIRAFDVRVIRCMEEVAPAVRTGVRYMAGEYAVCEVAVDVCLSDVESDKALLAWRVVSYCVPRSQVDTGRGDNPCRCQPASGGRSTCRALDPAAPPFLSGYCESVCHVTADCVDGAVCLHPSPCDGDPLTKGVCTLVGDADPALVECPDERP
jgi:hypothetical protein